MKLICLKSILASSLVSSIGCCLSCYCQSRLASIHLVAIIAAISSRAIAALTRVMAPRRHRPLTSVHLHKSTDQSLWNMTCVTHNWSRLIAFWPPKGVAIVDAIKRTKHVSTLSGDATTHPAVSHLSPFEWQTWRPCWADDSRALTQLQVDRELIELF